MPLVPSELGGSFVALFYFLFFIYFFIYRNSISMSPVCLLSVFFIFLIVESVFEECHFPESGRDVLVYWRGQGVFLYAVANHAVPNRSLQNSGAS